MSTFDFLLFLIVGEATQQAILGQDYSLTNALIVIATLVSLNIGLTLWKEHSPAIRQTFDGMPLVLVEDGQVRKERLDKSQVSEDDILSAARELQGVERMEQIKYAVLESSGVISIIRWADRELADKVDSLHSEIAELRAEIRSLAGAKAAR